jgi:hypothetical protein
MSERLVFELLAVDRATAPLKAVQTQLDNTTDATRRLGNQTSGATKEFRKFALGGLQQAGFQIGDFFVQVANGTNKMQAFGQQAPQLLQIFGPIGSVVGAAIAVFAAFSVIAEKSASAAKASADRYADALDRLSASTKNAKDAIEQFRFGDSVSDFTENEIKNLKSQASRLRQVLTELRTTETSGSSTGLEQITAMLARRSAVAEFQTRKEELRVVEEKLQVFRALEEAQRMLNGGLSVSSGIQKGIVYDMEVQLRLAREMASFSQQLAEGVEAPQKKLDIQREYQSLLQAGLKPIEAMAEAQFSVETALNRSKIASGKLTSDQVTALQATNAVLLNTFLLEGQYRAIAEETKLLEQGLSQGAIDGAKLAGLDLSNLTDAASDVLMLATNMGISVQAAANLSLELGRLNRLNQNAGRGSDSNKPIEFGTGPNAGKTVEEVRRLDEKRGGGANDPMKRLREQLALESELLGKTEAQQRVIQALGLDYKKYGETALNGLVGQITEMDRLNKLAEQQKEIASTIRDSFSSAFMSMVDGTKSVAQAFKDMTRQIIMKLYEQLVVQQMVNAAMGLVGSIFPSLAPALATAWNGGGVTGNKPVLVGEKGPEIIVPSRNSQVVANHQMGGGGVTVNQSISFGAGVTRAEIQAMLPKIVESTKAAVFDAQRRSVNGMGY